MSKNKNKILFTAAMVLAFFVMGGVCMASQALNGLNKTAAQGYLGDSNGNVGGLTVNLPEKIGELVGVALSLVGVVFLLLMIYGGFTWMIARGNEQEVEKAKRLIEAAVVGLIIVLSAYAITAFVGENLL